jgi:hypothetical protein
MPPALSSSVVPRAAVDALTSELHEALQRLFDEAYRLRSGELRSA